MSRFLAALMLALIASVAVADIAPPKGFKRVTVDYKITTDKDHPDYSFFTVIGSSRVTAVKLDTKTPINILAKDRGGRFLGCVLVAVPKDAKKNYASEKEFHAAIAAGKVKGQVKAKESFFTQAQVKDTEKRNTMLKEYSLTKINSTNGIVLQPQTEPKNPPQKGDTKEPSDNTFTASEEPAENDHSDEAQSPGLTEFVWPRGTLIAGLAAFMGISLGGLWIINRVRRKM